MSMGYKTGGGDKDQPYNENTGKYEKSSKSSEKSQGLKNDIVNQKFASVSKYEYKQVYDAIGEIVQGRRYELTENGKTYIPVGNKMFIVSGTYSDVVFEDLLEFDNQDELDEFLFKLSLEI